MDAQVKSTITEYRVALKKLFLEIKSWLKETNLRVEEKETKLEEEGTGTYKVPLLLVKGSDNNEISTFKPVGALIIAAKGRVDLIGPFSKENLFFLEKEDSSNSYSPYQGIGKLGWYWIDEKKGSKAHQVDKKLLFKLITEVSDYEF